MIKLLLKFITHPLIWITVLFGVLAAAVYLGPLYLLPYEQLEAVRGLQQGAWTALAVLWLASMLRLLVRYLQKTRPIQNLLKEKPPPGPAEQRILDCAQRLEEAQRSIRQLPPTATGGARPWLLMIGPSEAGKSTALRGSELSIHHLNSENSVFEVSPTRSFDWIRCGDAIALDTAGRYSTDDQSRAEWRGILQVLRENKHVRGVDGVVICVNLSQLVEMTPQSAGVLGERLRRQLDDVMSVLGTTPAVHLLLTHCDGLAGFSAWFEGLHGADAQQSWGHAFRAADQSRLDLESEFYKGFDGLIRALEETRGEAFAGRLTPADFRERLLFPAQFASLRAPVGRLIKALTIRSPGQDRCPLVGTWFASAQQAGAGRDRVEAELARGLGLPDHAAPARPSRSRSRPFFLRQLFGETFTRHAARDLLSGQEHIRRRRSQLLLLSLAFGVVLVGSASLLGIARANLTYKQSVEAQLEALEQGLKRPGPADPAPELVARLFVLGDWTHEGWRHEGDDELLEWAYTRIDVSPPSGWMWLWLRSFRGSLAEPAEQLLQQLMTREIAAHTGQLIDTRLLDLEAEARTLPELPNLRSGELMPERWQNWIFKASPICDLGRGWRDQYRQTDAEPAPAIEVSSLETLWLAELESERRGEPDYPAAAAGAALFRRWLSPSSRSSMGERLLPSAGLLSSVCVRLDPITPAHLLLASFGGSHPPPERLGLQPNLFFEWQDSPMKAPPGGFDTLSCTGFEGKIDEILNKNTFAKVRAMAPDEQRAVLDETRGLYEKAYNSLWLTWYDNIGVPKAKDHPLKGEDLQKLSAMLKTVYRPTDGELDRILLHMGRGAPVPETDPEDAELVRQRSWCDCQSGAWWAAAELIEPDGRLHNNYITLQTNMLALANAIEGLSDDNVSRRLLVTETFMRKGALYQAHRTAADLVNALETLQDDGTNSLSACQALSRKQEVRSLLKSQTTTALNLVWTVLLEDYAEQVETLWRRDILGDWNQLKRKYPFDIRAHQEADPQDLRAFLEPGEKVDAFIQEHLEPLIGDDASKRALWHGASNLIVESSALRFRAGNEERWKLLEGLEERREVTFYTTRQADNTVTQVTIRQDGREVLEYTMGPADSQRIDVSPTDVLRFEASRGTNRVDECAIVEEGGKWPYFRLVTNPLTGASPTQRQRLTLSGEDCSFSWEYQEAPQGPLWLHYQLIQLELPGDLLTLVSG